MPYNSDTVETHNYERTVSIVTADSGLNKGYNEVMSTKYISFNWFLQLLLVTLFINCNM